MVKPGMRAMGVTALAAIVAVLGLPHPASAADLRPSLECGVTPTTDVVLRDDLTCSSGFHFGPSSPVVDIDLNGHALAMAACGAGGTCIAVSGAGSVHDGHVAGRLYDIGTIDRVHVEGEVEMGAYWGGGRSMSITRSAVDGFVRLWQPDAVVDRNIIRGTVYLNDTHTGVRNARVTRNWIFEGGISIVPIPINDPWELSGDFSHNLIVGAPDAGILIGSVLENIGPSTVVGNTVIGSGTDGIAIGRTPWSTPYPPHPAATVRVEGNVTIGNGRHGINNGVAPDSPLLTVIDGGGNRALANGAHPACVGIVCTRRA